MPACCATRLVVISSKGICPSSAAAASRISSTVLLLRACNGVRRLAGTVMMADKRECDSHSCTFLLYYRRYARTRVADVDRRHVRPQTKTKRPQAVPAGADAGTAVSLQPGVRRLREDPIPRAYSQTRPHPRRVLPRRR